MAKTTVLVIAAHPDDEILGCGGAIARHAMMGDSVHVVIMAEGITSRDPTRDRDARILDLSELAKVAHEANKILGVETLVLKDFPDNRMDSVDCLDIVKVVEGLIQEYKPDIIYTHHSGDVNIDHRCIHHAVVTACRPLPEMQLSTLLFFEVASSTEWQPLASAPVFMPNWFIDISETLTLKMKALHAYASEMRPWPHARSVEAVEHLARWRGSTIGCSAAEGFMLGRKLIKTRISKS